jgi:hypothetical protein
MGSLMPFACDTKTWKVNAAPYPWGIKIKPRLKNSVCIKKKNCE